jgi:predicted permease
MSGILGEEQVGDNLLFLLTGLIFLYAGSTKKRNSSEEVRVMVGGMSILYLLSSVVLPLALFVVGLSLDTPELADIVKRAAVGGLSLLCTFFLPCEDDPPAGS